MKKYYSNIFIIIVSLSFLTVFIENSEVVDSLTAKSFYFQFISIFIFSFVLIWLFFSKKEVKLSVNKLDVLLLLFYTFNIVRLIFTEHVPINNEKFINLTLIIGYYFLFKTIFNKTDDKNYFTIILISVFLLSGLAQTLIGLLQFYNLFGFTSNYYRAIGSFSAMAPYSSFIITTLPFAFGLFVLIRENTRENEILKYLGMLTFIIGILILPIVKIRGDWLALFGGISVVLFVKYNITSKFQLIFNSMIKKVAISISALVLSVILIWGLYNIRPASAFGRILMWKVTTNIVADFPLIGAGFDRVGDIYNNYQAEYFAAEDRDPFEIYVADNVNYAHNDFLEVFAELGIIGFALFVLIIIFSIWQKKGNGDTNKRNKLIVLSAKASIIGMVISSQFTFPFQILPTYLNFIFLLSIISALEKNENSILIPLKTRKIKAISLIGAIILVLLILNTVTNFKANKNWQKAKIFTKYNKYDSAINLYSESYSELKTIGDFLLNYGGTLSLANKNEKAIEILEQAKTFNSSNNLYILLGNSYTKLSKFEESEKAYKHASNIIPNRLYPKYMLAKMYVKANKIDKAKLLATKIIETDAKVNSTAEKEIKNEMKDILSL